MDIFNKPEKELDLKNTNPEAFERLEKIGKALGSALKRSKRYGTKKPVEKFDFKKVSWRDDI